MFNVGDRVIPTKASEFVQTLCTVTKAHRGTENWDYEIVYDDPAWGTLDVYESEIRHLTKLEKLLYET